MACASIGQPPGGPQRKVPPVLVAVTPDSGAVDVKDKNVVFSFDVIVDDHAGRGGTLAGSFIVSPNDGGTVVKWRRDRIEVRPRRGFKPGIAYSVTMLPGVTDLNRNAMKETRTIVFSTGPTIPAYTIQGRVFDWMAERIVPEARIDIVRLPDSLPYVGLADSSGQFSVGPLEEGTYLVRALADANRNGIKDPNEIWDSSRVVITGESPFVEMRAAIRDTLGPRLLTVAPIDSLTLQASFDHALDPGTTLTADNFKVQRADSSVLPVTRVQTQAQFQRQRASRDSVRESLRRDSIARLDTTNRPPQPTPVAPPPTPPSAQPTGRAAAPVVTPPKPSVPAPAHDLIIELDSASALVPGASYRISVTGARSLTGVVRSSDRAITIVKRDTARTPVKKP
ncbi:MAG TPA: Ig-like domain-containing protein [Gemmatimonadaceae bacterium]